MGLKIKDILNNKESLAMVAQKNLPVRISYAITKNIRKIEKELEFYFNEKSKVVEKYSEKDENGKTIVGENGIITIAKEHIEIWNKEHMDLLNIDVDIKVHMINEIDLLNTNIDITPADLLAIDFMIE